MPIVIVDVVKNEKPVITEAIAVNAVKGLCNMNPRRIYYLLQNRRQILRRATIEAITSAEPDRYEKLWQTKYEIELAETLAALYAIEA